MGKSKSKVRERSRDAFAELDREIARINKSGELKVTSSKDKGSDKAKPAPPKQEKGTSSKQQKAAPSKQGKATPSKQPTVTSQPGRKGQASDAFAEMEGMISAGREKYGPGYRGETQAMERGPDGKKRVTHTVKMAKEKKGKGK
tara:strand:- start:5674 stop:6105 length:432 start_codon:yes stop_codon:yes gene_type:complete